MLIKQTMRVLLITLLIGSAASAQTADSIRKQLAGASSSITDLQGTMVIKPSSKSDAAEIGKGVIKFLEYGFREAKIYYKRPDKFRADGKSNGGIEVTYLTVGNRKQVRAPAIMLKKTDDLTNLREKKQSTLDVGFASDSLWTDNRVKLLSLDSKKVAKLKLSPIGTTDKLHDVIWLDTKSLKVVKREHYNGRGLLKVRHIYKDYKTFGKMPVATRVDVYAADGGSAGSIYYRNLSVNKGVANSLFKIL